MLLLPGTVLDAAVTFAERVRKTVEAHTFTFDGRHAQAHGELRRRRLAAPADRRQRRARAHGRRRALRRQGDRAQPGHPLRQRRVQRAPGSRRWSRRCIRAPTADADGGAAARGVTSSARLRARVAELQRERDHLVAIVDILQEVSASLHFVDILQTIARKLGETFGLDRCAIFLSGDKDESASSRATRIRPSAISSSTSIAIPS